MKSRCHSVKFFSGTLQYLVVVFFLNNEIVSIMLIWEWHLMTCCVLYASCCKIKKFQTLSNSFSDVRNLNLFPAIVTTVAMPGSKPWNAYLEGGWAYFPGEKFLECRRCNMHSIWRKIMVMFYRLKYFTFFSSPITALPEQGINFNTYFLFKFFGMVKYPNFPTKYMYVCMCICPRNAPLLNI